MFFGLRRRLALGEARRRGFEDGIAGSHTEPLEWDRAEEKVAYDAARIRGRDARESLGGKALANYRLSSPEAGRDGDDQWDGSVGRGR